MLAQVGGRVYVCGLEAVSRRHLRLGTSGRILQRRLAELGESFQTLVTQTRREAAQSLLRSCDHNVAEVAFLTGLSDLSAFSRAVTRWTGNTPASFAGASRLNAAEHPSRVPNTATSN